jgi:hypothetical protein
MTEFDPTVIERHAVLMYRRAAALVRGSILLGALLGGAVGGYPLTRWSHWPIPHAFGLATLLGGVLAGVAIGYVVGDSRATNVRLQAQLVLHQLQLERNTAAIAATLAEQVERTHQLLRELVPPAAPVVQQPPPRLVEDPPAFAPELRAPPLSA